MSINVNDRAPRMQKHDHVRPNPSNPLVQIQRDRSQDAALQQAELARAGLDPRGQPSKGGKLTDINAPTPTKPSLPLPERFKQPALWSELAGAQHPLYRTSAHVYGERPPAIQEMPSKYFGNSHSFTSTFAGGMHRDFGLNTAITHSKTGVKEEFGFY